MQEITDIVIEMSTTYGFSVLGALIILILGWIVAGWASGATRRALLKSPKFDAMLAGFFASIVKYIILIFTLLAVLDQFGVQTASLLAVFGAAGLAIGLALQGTLSNVAAGVMLLIFRPFKIGDFVEVAGHAGVIRNLSLFTTEMSTGDNVQIVIPNGQVWGAAVKNYSHHDNRRVDLVIGIGYGDNIDTATQAIADVIGQDNRILKDPAHQIVVSELADSSVNLIVRAWCANGNYWPVRFDLVKNIKLKLDDVGVSIPYPQQDLHVISLPENVGAKS
ncbi:MAG: mechanosensitive ion channel protein MscS [Kordiimonas sp.]|nr:mechanosensitive ion channel protein MscS [Kordiimonas sp.]